MSALNSVKKFEKHHAAFLVFMLIAGVFLINIFAFTAAYNGIEERQFTNSSPLIIVQAPTPETENDKTEEAKPAFFSGLEERMKTILDGEEVESAVYLKDLSTGETLGINQTTTFVSASLYKIFASYEVARQIDLGQIEPTDQTGYDAGSTSIEDCLFRTLSYSDNPCGRALRKVIEADDAPLSAINDAGFVGTSLVNDYPTTSASDVGLFFERLYESREFADSVNNMLLEPLLAQEVNDRLPVPLPEDTKIAHKTANLDGYSHDGGIFYTPGGNYVLVVLTGPWPNGYTDSPSLHISLSSLVYDWFNPTAATTSF